MEIKGMWLGLGIVLFIFGTVKLVLDFRTAGLMDNVLVVFLFGIGMCCFEWCFKK